MRAYSLVWLSVLACSHNSASTPGDGGGSSDAGIDAPGSACATSVPASPGTVITTTGPVTGAMDGSAYAWKGIPYAQPPTGDLRWKPPQPASCWSAALDATAFGPACPQLGSDGVTVIGDEACLTLNVWAPPGASGAPVMVFIHGGGNTQGSASDPTFEGAHLAASTGTVVVTVEYRLGALGFFANAALDAESPNDVSGNYGILDQMAALAWVKANIAGFGGSPDRVLLFGESAGGEDTLTNLASPLAAGLFQAALVESGGTDETPLAQSETTMQQVVDAVGCGSASGSALATCMRAVPAATLAAVPAAVGPLDSGMHYVATIDGYVLPASVPSILTAGTQNRVPLVIGTNGDETSRMVPAVTTEGDYESYVDARYGSDLGSGLLQLFPGSAYASPEAALIALTTDVTFTCPARRDARLAVQHEPVFRYHFTWSAPGPVGQAAGATHGIELPFVFATFSSTSAGFTPTGSDVALSDAIETYWSDLAGSGDPNGGSALAWPAYDAPSDPYLQLDTPIVAGSGIETTQCNGVDALIAGT